MRKPLSKLFLIFFICSLLLMLFMIVPIVMLFSVTSASGYLSVFSDSSFQEAVYASFAAGLGATLLVAALGIPFGYLLARVEFSGKSVVQGLVDLGLVIPDTVAGLVIFLAFNNSGVFGKPFSSAGFSFVDTIPGIIAAMAFVGAPFMVNTAKTGFLGVDPKLERVSMSLGAGRLRTFFFISLPLAIDSIVNGLVMTWAKAVASFGSIIIIAYFPFIAPTYIYNQFLIYGIAPSAAAAGAFLTLTLIVFVLSRLLINFLTKWVRA